MFLCVSPNPAIDKRLVIPTLVPGEIHRVRSAHGLAGGKATHVAMVLRTLGEAPHWIAPCGGTAGAELVRGLQELGIVPHAFPIKGTTRTNLELIDDAGKVTEILEPGPELSTEELDGFERVCRDLFEKSGKSAFAVFSGSLPTGAPEDLYARLIDVAHRAECMAFLDTSGGPLRRALGAKPDFVKPNAKEAGEILGMTIDSAESGVMALKKLCAMGAQSAAISLGAEGIVYLDKTRRMALLGSAIKIDARSTVGCGDSALAGFAKGIADGLSAEDTLKLAIACATANCFAKWPGAAQIEDIQSFRNQVKVQMAEGETQIC